MRRLNFTLAGADVFHEQCATALSLAGAQGARKKERRKEQKKIRKKNMSPSFFFSGEDQDSTDKTCANNEHTGQALTPRR